jgi:uncharacterized membrane protein YoaK (UPF0700 family)
MFHHGINSGFTKTAAFHWYLMSFLAGSVNAGSFLACERFVTHITGFVTLAGINFGTEHWFDAIATLSMPGFYLTGVMVAARLTTTRSHRGKVPNYAGTMGLVALCLLLAVVGGTLNVFGEFGSTFDFQHSFVLVALLCLAAGLQNAAITGSSGATIRTTHLTGITTDLGIGLVTAFEYRKDPGKYEAMRRKNVLRIGTIFAFFAGGSAGASLFARLKFLGFLMPMSIACYAVYVAVRHRNQTGVTE